MSTDKFGRHRDKVQTNIAFQRIQSRQAIANVITLTSDGDVNVNGKRIRSVGEAHHGDDAINKRYLMEYEKHIRKLIDIEITKIKNIIRQYENVMRETAKSIDLLKNDYENKFGKINARIEDIYNTAKFK